MNLSSDPTGDAEQDFPRIFSEPNDPAPDETASTRPAKPAGEENDIDDFDVDFNDDLESEIEGEYELEDDVYGEEFDKTFGAPLNPKDDEFEVQDDDELEDTAEFDDDPDDATDTTDED